MISRRSISRFWVLSGVGVVCASVVVLGAGAAEGAMALAGPVNLGTASTYGVLGASTVTNTGPTVVDGDVGLSPGTSMAGFTGAPNGSFTGTLHQTDAAARQAQADMTTAFNAAAGLTPTTSGLAELNGLSLTPGVYAGGALKLADTGALTLAGNATSVWVFQAASTLTIGSGTRITITGGATACNVFWEVGSSATVGTAAQFQGTVLAKDSITATTGATVVGRLLANTGAVTLDTNTITVPAGCPPVSTSPVITSGTPANGMVGTPYSFTVTATGSPAPTFAVTLGTLPAGLVLNATTGAMTGTPTMPQSSTFTITASNGVTPNTSVVYTTVITPTAPAATPVPTPRVGSSGTGAETLASTGNDPTLALTGAAALLLGGTALMVSGRRRRA
ncbi:ice-binding family protein [Glaciihabitans sp. UYNi722]|uniref:ice-binding family protein n=1 Tax=Glaciihabitans sp. UYNi722 TaxID=3156344 RepID=UPI00339935BE